ncbi:hypothetical protein ACYPKM_05480 [Pseudomonas aeruginosa]
MSRDLTPEQQRLKDAHGQAKDLIMKAMSLPETPAGDLEKLEECLVVMAETVQSDEQYFQIVHDGHADDLYGLAASLPDYLPVMIKYLPIPRSLHARVFLGVSSNERAKTAFFEATSPDRKLRPRYRANSDSLGAVIFKAAVFCRFDKTHPELRNVVDTPSLTRYWDRTLADGASSPHAAASLLSAFDLFLDEVQSLEEEHKVFLQPHLKVLVDWLKPNAGRILDGLMQPSGSPVTVPPRMKVIYQHIPEVKNAAMCCTSFWQHTDLFALIDQLGQERCARLINKTWDEDKNGSILVKIRESVAFNVAADLLGLGLLPEDWIPCAANQNGSKCETFKGLLEGVSTAINRGAQLTPEAEAYILAFAAKAPAQELKYALQMIKTSALDSIFYRHRPYKVLKMGQGLSL